jgi:hypothetical protein
MIHGLRPAIDSLEQMQLNHASIVKQGLVKVEVKEELVEDVQSLPLTHVKVFGPKNRYDTESDSDEMEEEPQAPVPVSRQDSDDVPLNISQARLQLLQDESGDESVNKMMKRHRRHRKSKRPTRVSKPTTILSSGRMSSGDWSKESEHSPDSDYTPSESDIRQKKRDEREDQAFLLRECRKTRRNRRGKKAK